MGCGAAEGNAVLPNNAKTKRAEALLRFAVLVAQAANSPEHPNMKLFDGIITSHSGSIVGIAAPSVPCSERHDDRIC